MSIDWDEDLLAPIYEGLGVPAVVTLLDGAEHQVTAIDAGEGARIGTNVEVPTLEPAAFVRNAELAQHGLSPRDLVDGTILLNGALWRIANVQPRPTPGGEGQAETMLTLYRDPSLAPATESDIETPTE